MAASPHPAAFLALSSSLGSDVGAVTDSLARLAKKPARYFTAVLIYDAIASMAIQRHVSSRGKTGKPVAAI
jgi:hypothetical protein